jgi:hypothetical protein
MSLQRTLSAQGAPSLDTFAPMQHAIGHPHSALLRRAPSGGRLRRVPSIPLQEQVARSTANATSTGVRADLPKSAGPPHRPAPTASPFAAAAAAAATAAGASKEWTSKRSLQRRLAVAVAVLLAAVVCLVPARAGERAAYSRGSQGHPLNLELQLQLGQLVMAAAPRALLAVCPLVLKWR